MDGDLAAELAADPAPELVILFSDRLAWAAIAGDRGGDRAIDVRIRVSS
jgi:hypothetical protein